MSNKNDSNELQTFTVEIDPERANWDEINELMAQIQDETQKYIESEAEKLEISVAAASDIVYLRGRSRWTQEKEDYLIKLAKEGKELPFIFDDFEVPGE